MSADSAPPSLPLERVLFALAGSVTLISALLAAVVSGWFLRLAAFVGVNQWTARARRRAPRVAGAQAGVRPSFGRALEQRAATR